MHEDKSDLAFEFIGFNLSRRMHWHIQAILLLLLLLIALIY